MHTFRQKKNTFGQWLSGCYTDLVQGYCGVVKMKDGGNVAIELFHFTETSLQ